MMDKQTPRRQTMTEFWPVRKSWETTSTSIHLVLLTRLDILDPLRLSLIADLLGHLFGPMFVHLILLLHLML